MHATFERSPDTQAVIMVLRGVNQEISYANLSSAANMSLDRTKSVLPSARRILRNESKILFGTVTGWGLKRLSDFDKVRKSESNKKRVRNAAGRALKELETLEKFELMPPSDQVTVTTNRTIFAMIRQHTGATPKPATDARKPPEAPHVDNLVQIGKQNSFTNK